MNNKVKWEDVEKLLLPKPGEDWNEQYLARVHKVALNQLKRPFMMRVTNLPPVAYCCIDFTIAMDLVSLKMFNSIEDFLEKVEEACSK